MSTPPIREHDLSRFTTSLSILSDSVSETVTFTREPCTARASLSSLPLDVPNRPWCGYSNRVISILKQKHLELRNRIPPLPPISFNLQNHSFNLPFTTKAPKPEVSSVTPPHNPDTIPKSQAIRMLESQLEILNDINPQSEIIDVSPTPPFSSDDDENLCFIKECPDSKLDDSASITSNTTNVSEDQNFSKSIDLCRDFYTVDYTKTPDWNVEPFIFTGYRPIFPKYKYCFRTVFRIHNETGNIWTHLIGALLVIFLIVYASLHTLPDLEKYGKVSAGSRIFLFVYLASALFCLSASSLFHTFICHSDKVYSI
ncbi:Adiponectin receptor protein 2 [Smittium mucronatum]|uniref:Adiponectin receptor protein 2 n=1 Tax=Smittium mucronatum TaxID=133383 RepID=A0A1R0GMG2_9FUNG|nr:Adiponectin receptor protein 2 [Smittium mucronatum]